MNAFRIFSFVAMALLALFFLPYVLKLKQVDLLIVLLAGLAMPLYDLLSNQEEKKDQG